MPTFNVEDLEKVFITRKEFDEKQGVLLTQMAEVTGLVKGNQLQITSVTDALLKQELLITKNGIQIAVVSTYAKFFGPLITAAVAVIGFLLGIKFG